jgi:GntR family transcriptional repressor for pyruvate dehydrogenase complex
MIRYLPVQSERLYEQIVNQIEARIAAGDLKVGDRLPSEFELAEQFEVSRTAIREAVKILRQKGLVDILPGKGTYVTNGTPVAMQQSLDMLRKFGSMEGYLHLVEVREIMEPQIAALAATRITGEYIKAMQEAYDTMEISADNADLFVEADLDFHLALAEATQNPLIPALMDTIIGLLREQRKQTALVEGGLQRGQSHHKKILEAIVKHDPQAARTAMQHHLEQVRSDSHAPIQIKE